MNEAEKQAALDKQHQDYVWDQRKKEVYTAGLRYAYVCQLRRLKIYDEGRYERTENIAYTNLTARYPDADPGTKGPMSYLVRRSRIDALRYGSAV